MATLHVRKLADSYRRPTCNFKNKLLAVAFTRISSPIRIWSAEKKFIFYSQLLSDSRVMGKTRDSKATSKTQDAKSPPTKKPKLEQPCEPSNDSKETDSFLQTLDNKRKSFSKGIEDFKFNKKRCRLLSKNMDVAARGGGVLYWMSRDQRVQGTDNSCFVLIYNFLVL